MALDKMLNREKTKFYKLICRNCSHEFSANIENIKLLSHSFCPKCDKAGHLEVIKEVSLLRKRAI